LRWGCHVLSSVVGRADLKWRHYTYAGPLARLKVETFERLSTPPPGLRKVVILLDLKVFVFILI
jgi:hypothetical protein